MVGKHEMMPWNDPEGVKGLVKDFRVRDPGKGNDSLTMKFLLGDSLSGLRVPQHGRGIGRLKERRPPGLLEQRWNVPRLPRLSHPCNYTQICPPECAHGLAEKSPGKKIAVSKWILSVEEEDVQIPFDPEVLEGIIQNGDLHPEFVECHLASPDPIRGHDDGNTGQLPRQEQRFIPNRRIVHSDRFTVGHNHCLPLDLSLIPPEYHCGAKSTIFNFLNEEHDKGGLAGAAGRDIPDADHAAGKASPLEHAGPVESQPPEDSQTVDPGSRMEETPYRPPPGAAACNPLAIVLVKT
jgi:hypothetical protein